ncbi:MAG: hypothetical protein ACRDL5_14310 [Solirubrobacteraceae bacterium]
MPVADDVTLDAPEAALVAEPLLLAGVLLEALELAELPHAATAVAAPKASAVAKHFRRTLISSSLQLVWPPVQAVLVLQSFARRNLAGLGRAVNRKSRSPS